VAANALQTFSLRASGGYLKRSWDDECIVYVPDARETHLLTAPCAHVMGLLEQGPATFESLGSRLRLLVDDAQDQEITHHVHYQHNYHHHNKVSTYIARGGHEDD
jgi:hypothetical protein